MESSENRVDFGEIFLRSFNREAIDPETGEKTTKGALVLKEHEKIKELVNRVFEKTKRK